MQILTGRRDTQLSAFLWQNSFSLSVGMSLQKPQLHQSSWVVGWCDGPGQGSSILKIYSGFSSTSLSSVLLISSGESSSIFLWKEDITLYVEVVIRVYINLYAQKIQSSLLTFIMCFLSCITATVSSTLRLFLILFRFGVFLIFCTCVWGCPLPPDPLTFLGLPRPRLNLGSSIRPTGLLQPPPSLSESLSEDCTNKCMM